MHYHVESASASTVHHSAPRLQSWRFQACRLAPVTPANTNLTPFSTSTDPSSLFRPPLQPSNSNHIAQTGCTDNAMKGLPNPKHCLPHPEIPFRLSCIELASPPSCRTLCLASGTLHVLPLQDAKPRPIEATQDFMRKHFLLFLICSSKPRVPVLLHRISSFL